jgi:threonyl-tRNA synthetase
MIGSDELHIISFSDIQNMTDNFVHLADSSEPIIRILNTCFPYTYCVLVEFNPRNSPPTVLLMLFTSQAKERDHRRIAAKQDLIMFHELSAGSAFWLPHGTRIYNKLIGFIKEHYWKRGYDEIITPNIYNLELWHQSGHALHYKDAMFCFEVEGQEWAMKPMNCPGHCLMFGGQIRSYRDLPIRFADFGVLHRNELSGALTGLTRVRRFQQDDAHIYCREDQIEDEVVSALEFMKEVYDTFGMTYKLELSTRPTKALGDHALWDLAEAALATAMNKFIGEGNWRVNAGDGAFYGPKIDIKVMDAMDRVHQCATIQLDFQLPIRFNLQYTTASAEEGKQFDRPVMIHRAMLGSVERMFAVLCEHYGGKWPFWMSPRQVMIIPVHKDFYEYSEGIRKKLHDEGFYADVDLSKNTFTKKVRSAQVAQYNFQLVVGKAEVENNTVNIRTRENNVEGEKKVEEMVAEFRRLRDEHK